MSKTLFCLTALLSLAATSCSNSSRIYPVSGKVTYDGHPAAGATVFFYRHEGDPLNDPMIMGIVKQDGFFELACGSLGTGAPAGEYDVVIEWKQRSIPNGKQGSVPDKLKGRYADPRHPVLHARVEAETNNLSPFDLTAALPVPKG
jgi:hypothetical protein